MMFGRLSDILHEEPHAGAHLTEPGSAFDHCFFAETKGFAVLDVAGHSEVFQTRGPRERVQGCGWRPLAGGRHSPMHVR